MPPMLSRSVLFLAISLAGCLPFEDARERCTDSGRCGEGSDGGALDVGVDAGVDAGIEEGVDAGCATPVFDGAAWVCPVRFDNPAHGDVLLDQDAPTAAAWCVDQGFLNVLEFTISGRLQCFGCYYQGGSLSYGLVTSWSVPGNHCDSCGCLTSVTCY